MDGSLLSHPALPSHPALMGWQLFASILCVLVVNFFVFVSVCGCCYDFVGVMSVILWVWLLGVCGCGCSEFVGVLVSLYVWL